MHSVKGSIWRKWGFDYSAYREQSFRSSDPPVRVSEQSPLIKDIRPSVVPYGILDK